MNWISNYLIMFDGKCKHNYRIIFDKALKKCRKNLDTDMNVLDGSRTLPKKANFFTEETSAYLA